MRNDLDKTNPNALLDAPLTGEAEKERWRLLNGGGDLDDAVTCDDSGHGEGESDEVGNSPGENDNGDNDIDSGDNGDNDSGDNDSVACNGPGDDDEVVGQDDEVHDDGDDLTLFGDNDGDQRSFNISNDGELDYFDGRFNDTIKKDENIMFVYNDNPADTIRMNHYPEGIMSRSDTEVMKRRSKIVLDDRTTRFSGTFTTYHSIFPTTDYASDVDGLLDDVTANDEDSGDVTSSSHNGDVNGGDDVTLISS